MHVEMVDVEGTILREIAEPRMKRHDVAMTYAFGLRSSEKIDWPAVNRAIMERWSLSALTWIKDSAWKLHEGRITPAALHGRQRDESGAPDA